MKLEKRVLFLDRDGTIIIEPETDQQVDSLEKLEFVPGVITSLAEIAKSGAYKFVLVSNQDGLGTDLFPEERFWPAHLKMQRILAAHGIEFLAEHIDRSLPHEGKPTRKPGIELLRDYLKGGYDLANSYVVGDRITDVQLAANLGCRAILLETKPLSEDLPESLQPVLALRTNCWTDVVNTVLFGVRQVELARQTKETSIQIRLHLDGRGDVQIDTGLGFFNHMLEQLGKHSLCDLNLVARGDLEVDEHHTVEDVGLALGEAWNKALGLKQGLDRYGFVVPMDESEASVSLDFSGRPMLCWHVEFKRERIGDVPTEMFKHFFSSFAQGARCTLHIACQGENEHHKIEAIFKAVARSLLMAKRRFPLESGIPSTKGSL